MDTQKNILITGGAGFIGSHVVRLLVNKYPEYHIFNLDALTYAGNLHNLTDVEDADNYTFLQRDICDLDLMRQTIKDFDISHIIHLAAESHVDRSISNPLVFLNTNILGTANLLQAAKEYWDTTSRQDHLFYQVSTDEVYGALQMDNTMFTEDTAYDPRSPYSASKASADHLVRAWYHTFKLPIVVSNCSNNYGSHQFPEKLVPLFIHNIKNNLALPVYGKGENVRDWLYVEDHARAIDTILHRGKIGETYNIGGHNEWTNIDLIHLLCDLMDQKLDRKPGSSKSLISFVTDRAGHDLRYAIDATKMQRELDWLPSLQFEQGIDLTIDWYLNNETWLQNIMDGSYRNYSPTAQKDLSI